MNYFDTAYIYPGNEVALGNILSRNHLRERVNIATKIPQYLLKKPEEFDSYFATELQRLKTDYIDYYLMHMLGDLQQWTRLCDMGVQGWIAQKKAAGEIRNIGFSYHGGQADFRRIVDAYEWDFCMIQYNYMDEFNQAGRSGLEYAAEKGLPVMIMEPLRGGRLATALPRDAEEMLDSMPGNFSCAQRGLRWLWDQPAVTTVLSGMNSMEMLQENVAAAENALPGCLSEEERKTFANVRELVLQGTRVACTGCSYCMPCPYGVDIPLCFSCYNETASNHLKDQFNARWHYIYYVWEKTASKCRACGKCEAHCPQQIPIRERLTEVSQTLEAFPYRQLRFIAQRLMKRSDIKR